MTDSTTVAVLGTGIMGGAMARNLADAGFAVRAWNRDAAKAEALAESGVEAHETPAGAVEGADVVITMLSDGPATRSVMDEQGALAAMQTRGIWAQMATVGIAATEELSGLAGGCGVAFVDAPVLGTRAPAENGELLVLASGPDECHEALAGVFDGVGRKTMWLGDAGQGTRLKLVVNSWIINLTAGIGEAVATAEALGVDPQAFVDLLDGAPMGSPYVNSKAPGVISGSYETSFGLELAAKDAQLVLDAVGDAAELRSTRAALEANRRAVELGHGEEDMSAVAEAAREPSRS